MPSTTRPLPPVIDGVRRTRVQARGVDFHVTEAGPQDGLGVLCLHGWPQHHYAWRDLLANPPAGLRIIAPDLPGYGWSGAAPHRWYKEEVASDLLALLDALGLERVVLVGHDWGGYVGHLLALRAPERFSAYLVMNIPHPWVRPEDMLPHLWRFYYQPIIAFAGVPLQRHTPFLRLVLRTAVARNVSNQDLAWFTDRFGDKVCARAASDTYRTFLTKEAPELRRHPEARRSTVPTRCLFGTQDVAIVPVLAAAETANAEDYTFEAIDAGHFVPDERPDLLRERLITLVNAFPPA